MIRADGAVVDAEGRVYARVANPEHVPAARVRIHTAHCRCRGDLEACASRRQGVEGIGEGEAA
ncbi:MAG: hypothetical protein AB7I38_11165 [Dehalococcoidia bacterium]